ncbi:glycosyltransferase family 4 protein (plasmid) [Tundrisphaera lichenicola]|uniref:glycosyltransferase family 4 protein n=1 Tax=Tundrisphaera lichenicola TaxID=2029860 RepID=UPI003EBA01D9
MTNEDQSAIAGGPLSVAFVCPGWPPNAFANGIIPYVAFVANQMRTDGHSVAILAQAIRGEVDDVDVRDATPFGRRRGLASRTVDSLTYRAAPALAVRRAAVRALAEQCRSLIRTRGLQLVEVEESLGWSRWLQRALPIPVVVRIHGPWFVNGPLRGAVEDEVFRRRVRDEGRALAEARAITSPSLDILERTRAYYQMAMEETEVIPNPASIVPVADRWTPEGCDPETIVFVGRFDRHKGGDLVIDAFAEVARNRPSARLRFAGADAGIFVDDDGQPRSITQHIALRFPDGASADRVEWLGGQPGSAIPGLRRKGAVVVVGSRYDNFPNTVLEAMAMGCPLVAPQIGGIPEMIEDGVNGLLYRVADARDMASKISRLLEDRPLAARLGHQASLDAERRYDPRIIARRTEDFFRSVIGSSERTGEKGRPR